VIKIVALDDNEIHLSLIEQALVGPDAVWDEPVELEKFRTSLELLIHLKKSDVDCVILDRNLPDIPGDLVLKWVRENSSQSTAVLILTSVENEEDVVSLLSAGADEYLTKPFHPQELLIRAQRLIKLYRLKFGQRSVEQVMYKEALPQAEKVSKREIEGFVFDDFTLTVSIGGHSVKLSDREYRLAKYFFSNIGVNLSRKEIVRAVYFKESEDNERSITSHVHLIREKLNLTLENGWIIRPIYGFGYRLNKLISQE